MSRKSGRKNIPPPRASTQRVATSPPAKNYLLIGKGGDVQKVSALDFVVAGQAQKIMRERVAAPQNQVQEVAGENKPDPETRDPVIDTESIITEAVGIPDLAAQPSILRGGRHFWHVKPVPLSPQAELLLSLTEKGTVLPKDLREDLINTGDAEQIWYAAVEGIKRGFEQMRTDLGLYSSKERR